MTDLTSQYGADANSPDSNRDKPAEGLAGSADQLRRSVTEKAGAAREWAGERAGAARDWAGERASVARDWASDQGDALRDTVQTRPFVAVGVSAGTAFAAGLVLGILLARR